MPFHRAETSPLVNPLSPLIRLWKQRRLIAQFSWRNVELQQKGSYLGIMWALLSPLLTFAVYAFVFVLVFEGRFSDSSHESRIDFANALFLSLSLVQIFTETLTQAPLSIAQNPGFVKKVIFPLEVLPAAVVGAAVIRASVSLVLVLLSAILFGSGVSVYVFALPLILVPLVMFSLGAAWALAALGVFIRDLAPFTQFLAVVLMFMSAVFYPVSKIPSSFAFLKLNPLLLILENARFAVIWESAPSWMALGILMAAGYLMMCFGYAVHCGARMAYADVL